MHISCMHVGIYVHGAYDCAPTHASFYMENQKKNRNKKNDEKKNEQEAQGMQ